MQKIQLAALLTPLIVTACQSPSLSPVAIPVGLAQLPVQAPLQVSTEITETMDNQVIIKYRSGFSTQAAQAPLNGAKVLDTFNTADESSQLHELPPGTNLNKALQAYSHDPAVEFAIPNVRFRVKMSAPGSQIKAIPTQFSTVTTQSPTIQAEDPLSNDQWYLNQMGMGQIWGQYGTGKASIGVAVLDTGVDYNHPDLAGKIINGPDYIDKDFDPKDAHGHGTHVAGIIAAKLNNQEGVSGLAPDVKILAIRVLDAEGSGSLFNIAKGIAYAANKGARVINLSLGSPPGGRVMRTMANFIASYAELKGSLVIAAAGNEGAEIGFPAAASRFLSVGAINQNNQIASFSNRGSELDVVAPGVNIMSTMPTYEVTANKLGLAQNYAALNGTSMATPIVSSQAALLWSQNPHLTPKQVRDKIEATTTDLGAIGQDPLYGKGLVNISAALGTLQ